MRLLAALYVAAVLTWVGCALIRADKYVWKGIIYALLFALGSGTFGVALGYLIWPPQ
jgi:hypothetical protein